MTKQEILDKFSDIDFVYNDSSKHDTLSRMLDELLKEQEAVEPVFEVKNPNVVGQFHCGNCHHAFCYSHYKFCPECGRKVKWNDGCSF